MQSLLVLMDANNIIGFSDIVVGQGGVQVLASPLKRYTGTIKRVDRRKASAKILIDLGEQSSWADVGVNVLADRVVDCTSVLLRFYSTISA